MTEDYVYVIFYVFNSFTQRKDSRDVTQSGPDQLCKSTVNMSNKSAVHPRTRSTYLSARDNILWSVFSIRSVGLDTELTSKSKRRPSDEIPPLLRRLARFYFTSSLMSESKPLEDSSIPIVIVAETRGGEEKNAVINFPFCLWNS